MSSERQIIIAHVPVLHEGYRRFFDAYPDFDELHILGRGITDTYRSLKKDIRVLDPDLGRLAIGAWYEGRSIDVIGFSELEAIAGVSGKIIMPDEDISRDLAERYFDGRNVLFHPIFLRWDRQRSNAEDPVDPDAIISTEQLDKLLIGHAQQEAFKSSDIWRRVGALISRDGEVVNIAHNQTMPHEHASWIDGDPRNNYNKGVGIEMSTFMHAEARLIAEAAQVGSSLEGTDMYVTTFPCSPCAMLVAYSGIKRLFYAEGYAVLDGKRVLEESNVQLVRVMVDLTRDRQEAYVPYPEK